MIKLAWAAGAFFFLCSIGLWLTSAPRTWSKQRALAYIVLGLLALESTLDPSIVDHPMSPRLPGFLGGLIVSATGLRMLKKLHIWRVTRAAWKTPLFLVGVAFLTVAAACWVLLGYADKYGWNGDPHPNPVGIGVLSWLSFGVGVAGVIFGAAKANKLKPVST